MKHIEERKCLSLKIDTWEKTTILKGKLHMRSLDDVLYTAVNILDLIHECAKSYGYDDYLQFTKVLINVYDDYERNRYIRKSGGI